MKRSAKGKTGKKPSTKQVTPRKRKRRAQATLVVAAPLKPQDLAARVAELVGRPPPEASPSQVPVGKRAGVHPKHPPCPRCGRALYKSMKPGAVKKSDPWAWCRNPACPAHRLDQSTGGVAADGSVP
jgi:hypothetical protein